MCTSVKKIHSSCDLATEFEPHQDNSSGPNTIYPTLSHNSIYYEENTLYNEISEHHHEEPHKNIIKTSCRNSPVEIHDESAVNIDLPPILWHGYETSPKILSVINTGQTVLINGQWTRCRPYIEGGPLNGTYIFSQIHFHSPSEHEIDGRRYPLEMHVVHYKTSYLTQERAMEEKDGTVVLVYLFQVVNTRQTVLSSITNLARCIEKENDRAELYGIVLNQILQPFTSNYYLYWGSISTTKNSYLLQWIISCSNLYVTQEEVDSLIKIMCTGGLLSEKQAPKMNPVNDVVYHVGEDDYYIPITRAWSKCQCRHICRSCNTCAVHKGECQSHSNAHAYESHTCSLKSNKKDVKIQTSCHKTSRVTSKSSVCSGSQKKKGKKKTPDSCEISITCTGSSVSSNSQSSICEDGKKKKKKGSCKASKVSSCPSVTKTLQIICGKNEDTLKKKSLSCLSLKKFDFNQKETELGKISDTESKVLQKSSSQQSRSSGIAKKSSKISEKSFKQKKKKSVSLKSDKAKKKEKAKKKKLEDCENAPGSSKQSLNDNQKTKKKNQIEKCEALIEVQCMPALQCVEKSFELLASDTNFKIQENGEDQEVAEPKELLDFCNSENLIQLKEEIMGEKTSTISEPNNEIKTIFEKKRSCKNKEPIVKDCTVNFLLSPNIVPSDPSYTLLTTESAVLGKTKNVQNECLKLITAPVTKMISSNIMKFENKNSDSREQPKELCLQTEIFFHTEKQRDFSACLSQDYNVAIIYNRNVLQEFKGTFSPKQLELGSYEKLELVPKYPDAENISVRLQDCFVKMESVDGFYIRARFLLNKIPINENSSVVDAGFCANTEARDFISMNMVKDAKDDQSGLFKGEKSQEDAESRKTENSNEIVLKNEILENQEFVVEMKKLDTDPEMNDKTFTLDSLPQTSEPIKKEEKKKKEFIEKSEKKLKDLFNKRKKTVYFICEKIEKDENSGKKIFVGSFRTKDEIKALSKDRNIRMSPDPFFPIEKSLESKKEKKMFLLSNKDSDLENLIRIESPMKQEPKLQSSIHSKEMDKLDNAKDLITLHTYKSRNSQSSCFKDEGKSIEFQNQEVIEKSNIFSPEEINKLGDNLEKLIDSSSLNSEKSARLNKSQIALIIIPIEGDDLSKIEVVLIEHLEKNGKNNERDNNEEFSSKSKKKNYKIPDCNSKKENDERQKESNVTNNDNLKEKEYIPCLNCYN